MNTNLLTIVKQIITGYGEAVLSDPQRLKAFFSDLAKDEPKPLRIAFGRCIEEGAYNALKNSPDKGERSRRKTAIAQRVRDEHGLDPAISAEALDILEAALYGVQSTMPPQTQPPQQHQYVPPKPAGTSPYVPPQAGVKPAAANVESEAMLFIKGGTFTMGSPASEPNRDSDEVQHRVTVNSFYMGKYEVTQREWREVMGNNPSYFKGDDLPVEQVSWYDAVAYCNKRSQREGLTPAYTISGTNVTWNKSANGYRLPTEDEWEYACRAGTTTPFSTGNNITTDQANYNGHFPYNGNAEGTYREKTTPVRNFAPNAWGLYDMHGNVYEWCWDWYGAYAGGVQTDPLRAGSGSFRVYRGGSWVNYARYLRSADRSSNTPVLRHRVVGFRLARNAE